eukprot:scaffold4428_cov228-Amphora_coffeaeformis.AAC.5
MDTGNVDTPSCDAQVLARVVAIKKTRGRTCIGLGPFDNDHASTDGTFHRADAPFDNTLGLALVCAKDSFLVSLLRWFGSQSGYCMLWLAPFIHTSTIQFKTTVPTRNHNKQK